MAAFAELPWLNNSGQFLQAIIAGGQHGAELARLRAANPQRQPMDTTASVLTGDPFRAAQAQALQAKTQQEAQDRAGAASSQEAYADLIRRGASPQEAFERSGLAQYGQHAPTQHNPVEVSPGNQLIGMDPASGKPSVLYTAPPKAAPKLTEAQARNLAHKLRGNISAPASAADISDLNALAKEYPDWVSPYETPAATPAAPVETNAGGGFSLPNWALPAFGLTGAGFMAKRMLGGGDQPADTEATNGLKIGRYTVQPVP